MILHSETVVTALQEFLSNIGVVLQEAVSWVGTIVGVIMDTPVLLVPVALGIGMAAIGIFKSLKD